MSILFQDVDQCVLQHPTELWAVILNFAAADRIFPLESRKILINVVSTVSKQFYQLTKKINLPLPSQKGPLDSKLAITNYCGTNGFASLLQYSLENGAPWEKSIKRIIIAAGHLDCLKLCAGFGSDSDDLNNATDHGHIDIVRYIMSKEVMPTASNTISRAVKSGSIEILQLFLNVIDDFEYFPYLGQSAAASGNLEMVKFIEQHVPLTEEDINHTTSVETLQYYLDKGFRLQDHYSCEEAAKRGDAEYIRLAVHYDIPLSTFLFTAVASMNNVELMKELRAKGCPWDSLAIHEACTQLDALKYLIENGCPWEGVDERGCRIGIGAMANVTLQAARRGSIECVKYLMDHNVPWPKDIIDRVMYDPFKSNELAMVKYLHERGCPWTTPDICASAARTGNLELLKYLHENGCPWDESTCDFAAKDGRVECLKYALDNGCPAHDETMDYAARSRSLEVLKLVYERGIPWNHNTCSNIMQHGQLEMLKFAHENGAPWSANTILEGLASPSSDVVPCLKYAVDNGCPWDPNMALNVANNYRQTGAIMWIRAFLWGNH